MSDWFWIRKRRVWGGVIVGFFKLFSVWITRDGMAITIAELSYRRILLWKYKIYISWSPFFRMTCDKQLIGK